MVSLVLALFVNLGWWQNARIQYTSASKDPAVLGNIHPDPRGPDLLRKPTWMSSVMNNFHHSQRRFDARHASGPACCCVDGHAEVEGTQSALLKSRGQIRSLVRNGVAARQMGYVIIGAIAGISKLN
ncbi:hypothetical protein BJ166DRAFT_130163 [Pestalotiopsis sp. NC0098]|nr:hypothetical protein BJ166DRAFT_130163 [Pestalotiopsis sp. NC0098]